MNITRALQIGKFISVFFGFQIFIQGIDAISGILIVRSLSKTEYAYFGIISTLSVSVLNIIVSGLLSYFILNGVRLKNNKHDFSKLFNELNEFLNKKLYPFFFISIPVLIFMLYHNGINYWRIFVIVPLIFGELFFRLKLQLLQSVLNIYNKFNQLQFVTVICSLIRLVLIIGSYYFLRAEIAYLSLVITYVFQYVILHRITSVYLVKTEISSNRNSEFKELHNSQLPLTLYSAIDAQLVIVLLTFLGSTELLGDVNAAGKISLIVVAVNAFINNVLVSKFAEINDQKKFIKYQSKLIGAFVFIYIFGILLSFLWPELFIYLIGQKYNNISPHLYLLVISICVGNLSSVIYSINFSKTWITKNWITIPFTVVAQVVGLYICPPNSFRNVSFYIILCAVPSLIINIYYNLKGINSLNVSENSVA